MNESVQDLFEWKQSNTFSDNPRQAFFDVMLQNLLERIKNFRYWR